MSEKQMDGAAAGCAEEDRIVLIEEAMDLIREAQEKVDEAVRGTEHEAHYEVYGRYGLDQLLGNGNPYDGSLPKLMEWIKHKMPSYSISFGDEEGD